jgi:hypothetical protein
MAEKYYDINKMAEIIIILKEKFGDNRVIYLLFNHLIRNESDHMPLLYKSKGVLKLEEQYKVSIAGLSRIKTRNIKALKGKIIIEHGLPESQAIKMCFNSSSKEKIKSILTDIKNNLVCITKEEDKKLKRGSERKRSPSGLYFEEEYKKSGIDFMENSSPDLVPTHSIKKEKLEKKEAILLVKQKTGRYLDNSNTMFANIVESGEWGFTRRNDHFNNDTHMILNDQNRRQLHYFFIESGKIKTPSKIFLQRKDKPDHSMLYFEVSDDNFKEKYSKYDFGKYKIDTISY